MCRGPVDDPGTSGAFLDPDVVRADGHRRAARVVLVHEGRVLVEHVGGPATSGRRTWWELPGGGIEPGETSEAAARRELAEETGYLDIDVGPAVATARVRAIGARRVVEQHATYHAAWLRSDERVTPRMEPVEAEDIIEVAWLTPEELAELPSLMPPSVAALARDVVAARLVPRRLGDHDLEVIVDRARLDLPADAPSEPSEAASDPGELPAGHAAVLLDDRVVRDAAPWTDAVHAWLAHCRDVGVDAVPAPMGVDAYGREAVGFVPGAVTGDGDNGACWPVPLREVDGMAAVGRMLARLRGAAVGFVPPAGAMWRYGPDELAAGQVISHGDVGHANLVWRGDDDPSLIDWEFAHPASPLHDLAAAACWLVPLAEFDHEARGFDRRPDRPTRLRALAGGAGVPVEDLLAAIPGYLDVEAGRVRELGGLGIPPWDGYLAAGQVEMFERPRIYLREHPMACTPSGVPALPGRTGGVGA